MEPSLKKHGNVLTFHENALLNNLVVQKTFQFLEPTCNLNTLKTVRLVCRMWRDESLSWWRKTAVLNLTPDAIPKISEGLLATTFDKMLDKMNHSSKSSFYRIKEKPFQRYKLENTRIEVAYSFLPRTNTRKFWRLVGPKIQHLVLRNVTFEHHKSEFLHPKNHFFNFLKRHMPNLKGVEFESISFKLFKDNFPRSMTRPSDAHKFTNVVYLKFNHHLSFDFQISKFPNLEHLEIDNYNNGDMSGFLIVFNYDSNSTIKRLDLTLSENSGRYHLDVSFGTCRLLELKHFTLNVLKKAVRSPAVGLQQVLEAHCSSLEVLEILDFPFLQPYLNFQFSFTLTTLTEIRLWGNVTKTLEFLRWTPNLKVLHMDLFGLEKQKELRRHSERWFDKRNTVYGISVEELTKMQLPILSKLEYLQINCLLPDIVINRVADSMPNLKKLRTVLKPGTILLISKQWPLLEELGGLAGSKVTDSDIVGYGSEENGLLDFKSLKSFHCKSCCDEGQLTDRAARLGFLKMSKLCNLQVSVSPEFSTSMELRLREKIRNVHIIRNYKENEQHKNWECCQNNDFVHFFRNGLPNICWT